jgi:hypothetical protein
MNSVETILLENINKDNSRFIFPTDIAASGWADHLLRLKGGTVAMNKFIAWDVFKQNSIKSKVQNKKSIPSALRKIFVSRLLADNAEAVKHGKTPILTSLIREKWAHGAAQFSPWLTELLPQLGSWFNRITGLPIDGIAGEDAGRAALNFTGDDRDMFVLALRYAQFLEERGLFEPAWETPPFNDEGMECFIFFPESLSDYGEYREILASSGHVKIVSAVEAENPPCDTFFYVNARREITEASLYIRALHENENVNWDAIALCLPDSENYEPYVLREFENRNIPFVKRSSNALTDYGAGRFFLSVTDCTSRDFAFSAFTGLVLNKNLPWKDSESIDNLVYFGINNNCISSWVEKREGKEQAVNVWEDAFEKPVGGIDAASRNFYFDLKRRLRSLRAAASFSEIRRQYFSFRERFFDMEKCTHETDLILSRCISELMYLIEIENSFPDVKASDPYLFFCEYLSEINYLEKTKASGVNILPYKTAAASPFDCHIVLGAGQDSLSVVYKRLDFLPRKKREELGIFDEDASAAFINMHKFNSLKTAAFFCSEQAFSGFTVAHSKIGAPSKPKENYANDPVLGAKFSKDYYRLESDFENAKPFILHENQKNGYENWRVRRKHPDGGEKPALEKALDYIRKKLAYSSDFPQKYSVSASSLNIYYQCSLKWLFQRVLGIENEQIEANLTAENISGIIYHAALDMFFSKIKEKDEPLAAPVYSDRGAELPSSYKKLLQTCVDKIFDGFPSIQTQAQTNEEDVKRTQMSALTSRFLRAEKRYFLFNLENCIARFLSLFSGCFVLGCETSYQSPRGAFFLNGKLDCILKDKDGKYIIVDFKLKYLPNRGDCTGDGDSGLCDFQLPMYITLAEEKEKIEIGTALFFSILNTVPQVIIGKVTDTQTEENFPKKEEDVILHNGDMYKEIMKEFDKRTLQFADEISTGKFSVFEQDSKVCYSCQFNRICRKVYAIKIEKNISLGKVE